jgi:choline dehydrogenase-like flavoprotein
METKRRSFLKAGARGALVLAAGGGIHRAVHTPRPQRFVVAGGAIDSPALLMRSGAPDPYKLLGKRTFLHPTLA